ncbi:MAG: energy transducer TonB, partial [Candidatus Eremiobacteraeota bacterium]|nr:energy transducer TonB [Candidatus Eremiobacteraeota bacterium]
MMRRYPNRWKSVLPAFLATIGVAAACAVGASVNTNRALAATYGYCSSPDAPARMTLAYQPSAAEVADATSGAGLTSTVLVRLDGAGRVVDDSVWTSSGSDTFDTEALRAVRFSRFVPESRSCIGTPGTYLVTVSSTSDDQLVYNLGSRPSYAFSPVIVRARCPLPDSPAHMTYTYRPEWPEVAVDQGVGPAIATVALTLDAD